MVAVDSLSVTGTIITLRTHAAGLILDNTGNLIINRAMHLFSFGPVTLTGTQVESGTGPTPNIGSVTGFATRDAFKNVLTYAGYVLNFDQGGVPTPAPAAAVVGPIPNLFVAGFFNPWDTLAGDFYFLKDWVDRCHIDVCDHWMFYLKPPVKKELKELMGDYRERVHPRSDELLAIERYFFRDHVTFLKNYWKTERRIFKKKFNNLMDDVTRTRHAIRQTEERWIRHMDMLWAQLIKELKHIYCHYFLLIWNVEMPSPVNPKGELTAIGESQTDERAGPKRWTATMKMGVVLRHMQGESLDSLSREIGVPASQIEKWHQAAVKGIEDSFKRRNNDPLEAALDWAKKRIGMRF